MRFFLLITAWFFLEVHFPRSGTNAKHYLKHERANLSCHYKRDNNSLFNPTGLDEIDKHLDELYDSMRTNGSYEEECHVEVSFKFTYLDPANGETTQTVVEDLALFLESLEIMRARYAQGLWGYCAKEGAEELIANITALKKSVKNFTLCNRDELLYCHPAYKRCLCMIDNMNFREVASEYWNDTEEFAESGQTLGKNQCTLIVGSDCPFNKTSTNEATKFICRPDSRCLYKVNKKPCDDNRKNMPRLMQIAVARAQQSRSTGARSSALLGMESSETNGTTNSTGNQAVENEAREGRNTRAVSQRKYRFIRDDYPSIHCQCYGYIGGDHNSARGNLLSSIGMISLIQLELATFYFATSVMF